MILAILQARMTSSRLPGKVMMQAVGSSMLEHMIYRISKSKKLDKIIVATTKNQTDDIIAQTVGKMNVECFRGSENDVLERFQQTSEKYNAKTIVRLCGDSPILHWAIIDKVIESYLEGDYDYASNLLPPPRTYPDGLLVEVFSAKILKEAFLNAKKPSEREHVTPYIWMNPQKFKLHKVNYSEDLSSFRFNLDYQEDYEFLKQILEKLSTKNRLFTLEEVIQWLRKNPDILKINSQIMPNLGWVKSLEEDKLQGFS